jgi:hypothetical protein
VNAPVTSQAKRNQAELVVGAASAFRDQVVVGQTVAAIAAGNAEIQTHDIVSL